MLYYCYCLNFFGVRVVVWLVLGDSLSALLFDWAAGSCSVKMSCVLFGVFGVSSSEES